MNRLTARLERILGFLVRYVPPVFFSGVTVCVLQMESQILFELLTYMFYFLRPVCCGSRSDSVVMVPLFFLPGFFRGGTPRRSCPDIYIDCDLGDLHEQIKYLESSLNSQWRITVIVLIMGFIIAFVFFGILTTINLKLDTLKEKPTGSSRTSNPDENLCTICLDQRQNCVFLPCRHFCTCERCAREVRTTGNGLCPVCRRRISELITVFH